MAPGRVGNHARLFENMVHENTTETFALCFPVDCDLPQEQHRDLPMIGGPPRPSLEFVHIHHAEVDGMVA